MTKKLDEMTGWELLEEYLPAREVEKLKKRLEETRDLYK